MSESKSQILHTIWRKFIFTLNNIEMSWAHGSLVCTLRDQKELGTSKGKKHKISNRLLAHNIEVTNKMFQIIF